MPTIADQAAPAPIYAHAPRISPDRVRRLLANVIAGNLDVESVRPKWARREGRRLDGVLPEGTKGSRQPRERF